MNESNGCLLYTSVQIKGVDSTIRTTNVVMDANSKLFVLERLMTDGDQKAESDIEVCMNGSGSSAQIISRSVGKGNSSQVFHPKAVGKNKCHAHIPVSYTHLDVYKRQELVDQLKDTNPSVSVELWDETTIQEKLMQPEARGCYKYWFENTAVFEEEIIDSYKMCIRDRCNHQHQPPFKKCPAADITPQRFPG